MSKFTYDDIVRAPPISDGEVASVRKAWVVGIFETDKEPGSYWKKFPSGVVYTIEFEDGSSIDVHEDDLAPWEDEGV
jgi:hypothetical protein